MTVYNSINEVSNTENLAVLIGNFDGLHKGHQYLVDKFVNYCTNHQFTPLVMTFVPHPKFILGTVGEHKLLTTYEKRRELLISLGINYVVEVGFNRDFSSLSPKNFLKNYIFIDDYNIKAVFVGHDFNFGKNKKGGFEEIKEFVTANSISAEVLKIDQYIEDGKEISSSLIRNYIRKGELKKARKYLGREFSLSGRIMKGDGRGRTIGFPTANLDLSKNLIIPSMGVYKSITHLKGIKLQSVTNVGVNPTFKNENIVQVETHILDFDQDIYGEEIEVLFIEKMREEMKFSSANELIAQINKDVEIRRSIEKK